MPKTYYDSELTGAQIEAALEAIDSVVTPSNNGKVLCIVDGKIKAKSASEWGAGSVLEPLNALSNGDYYPPSGVDGFSSVTVAVPSATLTTKSITQNGTYNASSDNADGYSSVMVDVQGGGSAVVQPLSVTQNGTYAPPSGVDGYAPVTVNVSGGGSDPSLPSEYQEVEYITFSQAQYILVENLRSNLLVQILASSAVSKSDNVVIGYKGSSSANTDFEARFNNGTMNLWGRNTSYSAQVFAAYPAGTALNTVRELIISLNNYTPQKFYIGQYAASETSALFGGNLYRAKCYSPIQVAGELSSLEKTNIFVPCYRKADNEAGIYDLITNTFYTNQGSGTFTVGPDVN